MRQSSSEFFVIDVLYFRLKENQPSFIFFLFHTESESLNLCIGSELEDNNTLL